MGSWTHAVRGRPTLKDFERFWNGSVRELKGKARKLKRHSMISNEAREQSECKETTIRMDKSLSTGICKNVNIVRFAQLVISVRIPGCLPRK